MADRAPRRFERPRATLAADLGGTHLRAALVDDGGEILLHRSVETPHEGLLPTTLVELLITVVEAGERPVKATVVGVPGPVNYDLEDGIGYPQSLEVG